MLRWKWTLESVLTGTKPTSWSYPTGDTKVIRYVGPPDTSGSFISTGILKSHPRPPLSGPHAVGDDFGTAGCVRTCRTARITADSLVVKGFLFFDPDTDIFLIQTDPTSAFTRISINPN